MNTDGKTAVYVDLIQTLFVVDTTSGKVQSLSMKPMFAKLSDANRELNVSGVFVDYSGRVDLQFNIYATEQEASRSFLVGIYPSTRSIASWQNLASFNRVMNISGKDIVVFEPSLIDQKRYLKHIEVDSLINTRTSLINTQGV